MREASVAPTSIELPMSPPGRPKANFAVRSTEVA